MIERAGRVAVAWLAGLGGLLAAGPAPAQQTKAAPRAVRAETTPALTAIAPPSASCGASVEWTVTGRNLSKVDRWLIDGDGVAVVRTIPKSDTQAIVVVRVADDAPPGFREVRAVGPHGISNLALMRVDRLPQAEEAEPNDEPAQAQKLAVGVAVVGVLKPQDVDYYRILGRAGQRVTVEVEAQRLGTPIAPVLAVMVPEGPSLGHAAQSRGAERDSRLSVTFPEDGNYLLQVRDALYGGGDSALYRLRIDPAPYATALFPIGGPPGQSVEVTASGGNLPAPLTRKVDLPDRPGAVVEVGPFDGPDGPVLAPARLIVGDGGPELVEGPADGPPAPVPPGSVANGRIGAPGEVDRFAIPVKKGEAIGLRVRAAASGSWLDSVLTLSDAKGKVLAESDDLNEAAPPQGMNPVQANPQQVNNVSLAPDATDSRLTYTPEEDGVLTAEVTDRYGDGGPEYGYRLEVGPARPDFSITLLVDPNLNNRAQVVNGRRPRGNTPGITGALSLRPGSTTPLNFLVTIEGATGPITVSAEGLPPGVTASPVTVRPLRGVAVNNNNARARGPQSDSGALNLRVAADAAGELGEVRIVGTAKPEGGPPIVREAAATINLETNPTSTAARAVTRVVHRLPVRVLGEAKLPAEVAFAGPPRPVGLELKAVKVPGTLLQGGRLELPLEFDPARPPADAVKSVQAEAAGKDLAFQTVMPTGDAGPLVRVIAAVAAEPGPREVTVSIALTDGRTLSRPVTVEVRPPLALEVPEAPIELRPGRPAKVWVGVRREPGCTGSVDLKVDGLPKGVRLAASSRGPVKADEPGKELILELAAGSKLPGEPVPLRVAGVVRMPRGPVRVDSAVRPMLMSRSAEK